MSHEKTITVGLDNKFYNIPTVIEGQQMPNDAAIDYAISAGALGDGFVTEEEAIAAAEKRSKSFNKVIRTVKLPTGDLQDVNVPEDWGAAEIKDALIKKGIIESTEPPPERTPAEIRHGIKQEETVPEPKESNAAHALKKALQFIDRGRSANVGAVIGMIEEGPEAAAAAYSEGIQGEKSPLMGDYIFDKLMEARNNPEEHPTIAALQNFMGKRIQFKMPTAEDWGIAEIVDDDPARVDAGIATTWGITTDILLDPLTYTGTGLTKQGTLAKVKTALEQEGKQITDPKLLKELEKLESAGKMQEFKATLHERLAAGQEKVKIAAIPVPARVSAPVAEAAHDFARWVKQTPLGKDLSTAFNTKAGLVEGIEQFSVLESRLANIVAMAKEEVIRDSVKFTKDVKRLAEDLTVQTGKTISPNDLNRIIVEEAERAKMAAFVKDATVEEVVKGPLRLRDKFSRFAQTSMANVRDKLRPEAMTPEMQALIVSHPEVQQHVAALKYKNMDQILKEVDAGISIKHLGDVGRANLRKVDDAILKADQAGLTKTQNPITGKEISVESLRKQSAQMKKEVADADQLDYFIHAATPEAQKHITRKAGGPGKKYSIKHASTLQRKFQNMSVKQINDLAAQGKLPGFEGVKIKQFFYDDPAIAQGIRDLRHRKAMAVANFFSEAKAQFGRTTAELKDEAIAAGTATKSTPVREIIPEGWATVKNPKAANLLKGHVFPEEIAKRLDSHYEALLDPQKTSAFLSKFDQVQNWWKAWTLSIFPAYHVRNAVGNVWNNFVTGTTDPTLYATAMKMQNGGNGVVKTVDGRRISFDEVRQHLDELGIKNRGFMGTDIETTIKAELGKARWATLSRESKLIHYGRKVGEATENNARIAKFIDELQKGNTFHGAADAVRKALFDYSDLTKFEKSVAKRLMPFYTWSRKNIPLQVESMIRSPGKYKAIDTIRQEIEANVEDQNEYVLADWMLENYPVRVKIDETDGKPRYFMLGGWLPAADVWTLAANPTKLFTNLLSPIIKTPMELFTNKDFMTMNNIKNYDAETVSFMGDSINIDPRIKKLLSNIRVLTTMDRMLPESYKGLMPQTVRDMTAEEKLIQFLTGVKLYGIDLQQQKVFKAKETAKRLEELGIYMGKAAAKGKPKKEMEGLTEEMRQEIKRLEKIIKEVD